MFRILGLTVLISLLLILGRLLLVPSPAQPPADAVSTGAQPSKSNASLLEVADQDLIYARYESALAKYEEALDVARRDTNRIDEVHALNGMVLGLLHLYQSSPRAESLSVEALALGEAYLSDTHIERAKSLLNLGWFAFYRYLNDESIICFQQALDLAESVISTSSMELVPFLIGLARAEISMLTHEDAAKAAPRLWQVVDIVKSHTGEEHPYVALSYDYLGRVYERLTTDLDMIKAFHYKSLTIRLALYGPFHVRTGNSYNQLRHLALQRQDYKLALDYARKALDAWRSVPNSADIAVGLANVAGVLQNLGRSEQALHYLEEALKLEIALHGQAHYSALRRRHTMADILELQGSYSVAYAHLDTVLTIEKSLGEVQKTRQAWTLLAMSRHYYRQGDIARAMQYSEQSIFLVGYKNIWSLLRDARLLKLGRKFDVLNTASEIHQLFLDQTKLDSSNLPLREKTFRYGNELIQNFRHIRKGFITNEARIAHNTGIFFTRALEATLGLHEHTRMDSLLRIALTLSEESKAYLLNERRAQYALLPDTLRTQARHAESTRNAAKLELLSSLQQPDLDLNRIAPRFLETQLTHAHIQDRITHYVATQHSPTRAPATLAQLQSVLPNPHTALLSFDQVDDQIVAFFITADTLHVERLPHTEHIAEQISQFNATLAASDGRGDQDAYVTYAANLYDRLLAPLEVSLPDINHLIIAPDGPLTALPFGALLTETPVNEQAKSYRSLPYLIRRYTLQQVPSLTFWYHQQTQPRSSVPDRAMLAVAPVFANGLTSTEANSHTRTAQVYEAYRGDRTWLRGTLQHSEEEVEHIAALFKRPLSLWQRWWSPTIKILPGEEATEQRVRQSKLERYRYLHFATHAFTNQIYPELNALLFHETEAVHDRDGVLHLPEVETLSLQADLVVLSACATGRGKIVEGEGALSLGRGFLGAGARSVLMSTDEVNDASTKTLMISFYEAFMDGEPSSKALQSAQLDLIEQKYRPSDWAFFSLYGSNVSYQPIVAH